MLPESTPLEECEAALQAHKTDNPQEKHGKHEHSLAAITVSREEMLERFANYIDHFGVRT